MKISQEIKEKLLSLNYDEEEIKKIAGYYAIYDEKPFTDSFIEETGNNFINVYNALKDVGFEDEKIREMTLQRPQIYIVNMDVIRKNIGFINSLGYDAEALKKIIAQSPDILANSDTSLEGKKKVDDIYQSVKDEKESSKSTSKSI